MDKLLVKIKKIIPVKLFKTLQPAYHFILSWASSIWYGRPSEKIIVIGVTGTSGKTTSVYLIAKTLTKAGYRVGFTSTAMFNDGVKEWLNDKKMTMAGRFFTQKMLKRMVKNQCRFAVVETTSEGIVQFRHRFINYDILIFTGFYPEHLESHGGFDRYRQAKGRLFKHLRSCRPKYVDEQKRVHRTEFGFKKVNLNRIKKTIIVNADDQQADYFLNFWSENKIGIINQAELVDLGRRLKSTFPDLILLSYSEIETTAQFTKFKVAKKSFKLQLLGEFNVVNAMTAVAAGLALGLELEQTSQGLASVTGVPGRFEKIDQGQPFTVIVDYAFEPRAVARLYQTVELMRQRKIIHLLGSAGGGRDSSRRQPLGKIAGGQADYVIVTSEDPYDDDPQLIIDQVAAGALAAGKRFNHDLFKILDRRRAINKALSLAGPDDVVLITGKGSEQAICLADGEKINWDDRQVAREELAKIKFKE